MQAFRISSNGLDNVTGQTISISISISGSSRSSTIVVVVLVVVVVVVVVVNFINGALQKKSQKSTPLSENILCLSELSNG